MKRAVMLCASLIFLTGAYGCKTTSTAESAPAKASPGKREKTVQKAPANIPADSPFAKVTMGMQRAQVDDLIGDPTSTRVFPSGKSFIPYYYGPDTTRTGAFYKGLGRIVFSGARKVVEIEYDPSEDGY